MCQASYFECVARLPNIGNSIHLPLSQNPGIVLLVELVENPPIYAKLLWIWALRV